MRPSERKFPDFEITASDGLNSLAYSDRTLPAAETVRRVWPHLAELGITRVARQTGLDRIGIPCWAAFRPNSRNLAGAQGKGLSDAAACISATMEAVEGAVAEAPAGPRRHATADELTAAGDTWLSPERWLPYGTAFDTAFPLTWLAGVDLTGAPRFAPIDIVDMDGERSDLAGVCKNSNGLASGNNIDEASFHALCELVERDATTLWGFIPEDAALQTAIDPAGFADPTIDGLVVQIAASGMQLRLFDQTSDLGIPVVMAVLGPPGHRGGFVGELEVTAGYGAHPVASRAAIRAITEAAQSRVTSIAASRDDIHSAAFGRAASDVNLRLLEAVPARPVPSGLPLGTPLHALTSAMTEALAAANVGATVLVLSDPEKPYAVVKILSADLEDRAANLNWRPGWRAFDAVARL